MSSVSVSGSISLGPNIITEGLRFYYDIANNRSYNSVITSSWIDLTPNRINATITGTTTFYTASLGGVDFSGGDTTPSFSIPNPTVTTESFAIDVWITQRQSISSSTDYIRGIISCGDLWNSASPGGFPGWAIGYIATSPAESSSFNAGGRFYSGSSNQFSQSFIGASALTTTTNITLGSSYNLLLHRNTADQKLYFYINGRLASSASLSNTYSISGSQATINSRVWEAGSIDAPKAIFHNIKMYVGKNFTADEITQNYNALKYRFGL
jgi:hypothetical protein